MFFNPNVSISPALNVSCGSVDDFECGNGDCINYSLTCDGMPHCKDKSDEKQSYCGMFFFINLIFSEQWALTGHHLNLMCQMVIILAFESQWTNALDFQGSES